MKKAFKLFAIALTASAMMFACDNTDDPNNPDNPGNNDQPGDPVLIEENFDGGAMPSGWTNIDADADGYAWVHSSDFGAITGNNASAGCVISQSYDNNYGPLTPNNYLVTPVVKIPNGKYSVSWAVCGQDASYANEYYEVHVGTVENGQFVSQKKIYSETVTAKAQGTWRTRTVELADFAGKEVAIAFRHCDVTDMFYLDLDDVKIFDNTL